PPDETSAAHQRHCGTQQAQALGRTPLLPPRLPARARTPHGRCLLSMTALIRAILPRAPPPRIDGPAPCARLPRAWAVGDGKRVVDQHVAGCLCGKPGKGGDWHGACVRRPSWLPPLLDTASPASCLTRVPWLERTHVARCCQVVRS